MDQLTVPDVLKLVSDLAQWCRENGEPDMRNILNMTRSIKTMLDEGKSRDEILARFKDDEDTEDDEKDGGSGQFGVGA